MRIIRLIACINDALLVARDAFKSLGFSSGRRRLFINFISGGGINLVLVSLYFIMCAVLLVATYYTTITSSSLSVVAVKQVSSTFFPLDTPSSTGIA